MTNLIKTIPWKQVADSAWLALALVVADSTLYRNEANEVDYLKAAGMWVAIMWRMWAARNQEPKAEVKA